jgi:hypothetical protein
MLRYFYLPFTHILKVGTKWDRGNRSGPFRVIIPTFFYIVVVIADACSLSDSMREHSLVKFI